MSIEVNRHFLSFNNTVYPFSSYLQLSDMQEG